MLAWLRSTPKPRRSSRLTLEALEARDCPAAPSIINFQIAYNGQRSVTFTGQVQDESPANIQVQFAGAVGGNCMTGPNGSFTYTVANATLGWVGATATDNEALQSNQATGFIETADPEITNFRVVHEVGNIYTISGHVTDESAVGLSVNIYNIPGVGTRYAVVDANGNFSLTLACNNTDTLISAAVMDCWSVWSDYAYAMLIPAN